MYPTRCTFSRYTELTDAPASLAVATGATRDDIRAGVGCPQQLELPQLDASCQDPSRFCEACVPQLLQTLHPIPKTVRGTLTAMQWSRLRLTCSALPVRRAVGELEAGVAELMRPSGLLQGTAGWSVDPRDQAAVLQCLLPVNGQLKRAAAGQGVDALISCSSFQQDPAWSDEPTDQRMAELVQARDAGEAWPLNRAFGAYSEDCVKLQLDWGIAFRSDLLTTTAHASWYVSSPSCLARRNCPSPRLQQS